MNKIKQTEQIPPALAVEVKCYHARRKNQRVSIPRMYTVNEPLAQAKYLLTRYMTELGVGMSCMLEARETGSGWVLQEAVRDERKREGSMILRWMEEVSG